MVSTRSMSKPITYTDFKSYAYVGVQAGLIMLLVFLPSPVVAPSQPILIIGQFLEALGAGILLIAIYNLRHSLTVLPTPTKQGQLQINGLYHYIRHPMYTAVITMTIGLAVSSGWYLKYLLALSLVVLFIFKARYEESLLQKKYPEYGHYVAHTGKFFPFF